MDKVTAAAKQANGRSRACNKCPVLKSNKACPEMYLNVCTEAFVDGFKKGAKWQINHVWHNATEIPEIAQILLVEYEDGHHSTPILYTGKANRDGWKKWAYVKDLLPIKN